MWQSCSRCRCARRRTTPPCQTRADARCAPTARRASPSECARWQSAPTQRPRGVARTHTHAHTHTRTIADVSESELQSSCVETPLSVRRASHLFVDDFVGHVRLCDACSEIADVADYLVNRLRTVCDVREQPPIRRRQGAHVSWRATKTPSIVSTSQQRTQTRPHNDKHSRTITTATTRAPLRSMQTPAES